MTRRITSKIPSIASPGNMGAKRTKNKPTKIVLYNRRPRAYDELLDRRDIGISVAVYISPTGRVL